MSRPEVTVVIPTLGACATLERVLAGLGRQDAAPDSFEVVVVVDAASAEPDAVEPMLASRPYPARWITGAVPGASANRNAGWREARAPLVIFTDDDTIPARRWVSEHRAWHERHPEPETAVLGLVRWARELNVTVFMRWLDTGIQFNYANITGVDVGWSFFYTANVSLKRAFIERVGDFDAERLPYLYEDVDWSYRAKRHGFRVLYNRRAVVDHLRPLTLEDWQRRARNVARAEHTFTRLHPEMAPWFHEVFTHAASLPPVRGRGLRLARFVPRRVPWLGPRVWDSVDMAYKQAIAPHFLEGWNEAVGAAGAAPAAGSLGAGRG